MVKVIGILGGMGPQATIDLYQKILNNTKAHRDQDHLQVLIWSDPHIPDRTEAILRGGADPTPALCAGARKLAQGGAQCIAIPCNTAHFYLPAICESTPEVLVVDMIEATARVARRSWAPRTPIAVTGTVGALSTGLYQRALEAVGLTAIVPSEEEQEAINRVIFGESGVKAGHVGRENEELYLSVCMSLAARGAACVIAGCTELPLVAQRAQAFMPILDPTDILAKELVRLAKE